MITGTVATDLLVAKTDAETPNSQLSALRSLQMKS